MVLLKDVVNLGDLHKRPDYREFLKTEGFTPIPWEGYGKVGGIEWVIKESLYKFVKSEDKDYMFIAMKIGSLYENSYLTKAEVADLIRETKLNADEFLKVTTEACVNFARLEKHISNIRELLRILLQNKINLKTVLEFHKKGFVFGDDGIPILSLSEIKENEANKIFEEIDIWTSHGFEINQYLKTRPKRPNLEEFKKLYSLIKQENKIPKKKTREITVNTYCICLLHNITMEGIITLHNRGVKQISGNCLAEKYLRPGCNLCRIADKCKDKENICSFCDNKNSCFATLDNIIDIAQCSMFSPKTATLKHPF